MEKPTKDRQLVQYELIEYFGELARNASIERAGEMIIHNLAEKCPAQYLEDMDAYLCGKLAGLIEVCLAGLQSVPVDRSTPIGVKSALSHLGMQLADIKDPKLAQIEEFINGK